MLQFPFANPDTRSIEDALQHSPSTLPTVLTRLLSDTNRAEYAIASLSAASFAQFVARTEEDFPYTAHAFLNSTTSSILSKVSSAVVEMVRFEDVDLEMAVSTESLKKEQNMVILAQPALIEIARLSSTMIVIPSDISIKPFADLNMDVPRTRSEISVAERNILENQLRIFKASIPLPDPPPACFELFQFFLEVLRDPEAVRFLEKAQSLRLYDADAEPQDAGSQATGDQTATAHPDFDSRGAEAEPKANTSDAVYEGSAPRAALYVDNVQGFGEWKVNVTDNANSQLRKLRKRSPETLRLVMKKIKDLSRGHFSSDNQIIISETENAVPIFKANVSGDTRLIYQVDCVTDAVIGGEYQALRIFGVYNHAELGRMGNFWDALGRDLGRQGKKYRDNCRARSHPRKIGGNDVFSPLTFSGSEQPSETSTSKVHTMVENLEELDYSMILSMYRCVRFSKALLNSLIADRDVEFMFDPSSMERKIIEHPHSCYVIGRSGTGKTLTMMYRIVSIERGWSSSSTWGLSKPRQLFVTRSRMLAGEVQRTTDELMESFRLADLSQEELAEIRKGQGEHEEHRRPLPKKWSQLEDDHFPLFIDFDRLRDLLEADFAGGIRPLATPISDDIAGERDDSETGLVSGRRFMKAYWDHLPRNLTKGLDPASVFAEMMGVIQGSEGTIDTPSGFLSRESYLRLSTRSQPTFASIRARIYDIFEGYMSLKRRRGEHDDAERTHRLLAVLATHNLPGHPVQFLYIDEAQDNLIIDMLFLRSLCNNLDGLFWAGDTAQTITLGSSFKFSELTSMMYRIETQNINQSHIPPQTFHLAVNYRSHSGITDCAHTVVELLTTLWPETIDKLSGDKGWREGPRPVFIKGSTDLSRLFGQKDSIGGPLELGAEQCIIVHDEASREALFAQGVLGGLILTVFQSKGLEFKDVFLWNFFENSEPDEREWDTVCGLFNDPTRSRESIDKYRNVCRELKSLYVAITRARSNLFVIEESSHRNPVLELWKSRSQIDVQDGSTYSFKLSNVESLPEDWARRGRALMDKRQYEQAKYCFDKAGLSLERDVAQAYLEQESAITAEDFARTARRFQSCAEISPDRARSKELLFASAMCYNHGGNHPRSAQLYHDAFEYTKSVRQYCKASMMEEALDVARGHREDIDSAVVKDVCVHFLDLKKYERVADLFTDPDECIQFMKSHYLITHLAAYLESLKRFGEAADVHFDLGNITTAITLFLRDNNQSSVARGTKILLDELWRRHTLGQQENRSSKLSSKLIDLLSDRQALLGVRYQDCGRHEDELRMFSSIISRSPEELLRLGMQFSSGSHTDSALLSLDYAFTFLLDAALEPSTLVDCSTFLPAFCAYATLLKAHCRDPRPSKALGVLRTKLGLYNILEGTFLHRPALALQNPERVVRGGVSITASSMSRLLRETLGKRLESRISLVNEACKKVTILQPCISYCLSGKCAGGTSVNMPCRGSHRGGRHPLNIEGIHLRIRLLCQMIIAYGTLDASGRGEAVWKERNYWMLSLSSSIHIPFFALGTPLMFHSEHVPEFMDACRVLNGWITDVLYIAFDPRNSAHWIPSVEGRKTLIPRAVLLGYMLDSLREAPETPSTSLPLKFWYGPSYVRHLQELHEFIGKPERKCSNAPGALVYIRFLLDQRGDNRSEAVLAHLVEGLATAFILSRPGPNDRSLHNIILGRGWLMNLVDLWHSQRDPPSHNRVHIDEFVNLLGPILRKVYTSPRGNGVQTLRSESVLSNVSRVVKAFFLVGHWIKLPEKGIRYRESIFGQIADIPKDCRPQYLPDLFVGSAEQQSDWDYLAQAIWSSNAFSSTSADQLIHVQKRALRDTHPMATPGAVVRVVYNMLDSLRPLLAVPRPHTQPQPIPSEWLVPKYHPAAVEKKGVVLPEAAPCFCGQLRPVAI